MSITGICDFLRENPFRPPDWRWKRAAWLVANKMNASRKRDDGPTCRAVQFMRNLRRVGDDIGCRRLMGRFPDIVLAVKLSKAGPLTVLEMESRILGRQPSELIAEHLEVPITVAEAYRTFFFDVDDRIDSTSLIMHTIIGAPILGDSAERWTKLSAYLHGPTVIEPWLDYLRHRDKTHDLNTLGGWRHDLIDIFLRAQELEIEGTGAEQLVKNLPFIMGSWQKNSVFRSVSSVFHEIAMGSLSRLSWPQPAVKVGKRRERQPKPSTTRYKASSGIANAG